MAKLFYVFSLLLLIYMVFPGPTSINNFSPLPDSTKSTLSGDTWQVPNVAAYFSNNYRDFATLFYYEQYKNQARLPFAPIRLNYPPEFAFTAIKDQTQSTYLEEYIYPLRDSLFVNGLEPFDEKGRGRYSAAVKFVEGGGLWETKATLRFYPSSILARITVWIGIIFSIIFLWKLGRKILRR